MSQTEKKEKVVICGGGNAAHIYSTLAAMNPNNEVWLFSLYSDEAERFGKQMEENKKNNEKLTVEFKGLNIFAKPIVDIKATNDPAKCLPDADIIVISLPAFVHGQYLEQISLHVGTNKETVIGVFPAASGLNCEFKSFMNKNCKNNKYSLVSFNTLPWACRVKEFGKQVEVLGIKDSLEVCVEFNQNNFKDRIKKLSDIMYGKLNGDKYFIEKQVPKLSGIKNGLTVDFYNINMVVHSTIMYDTWSKWDGKPLDKPPLFYQGLTQNGADFMSTLSTDMANLGNIAGKALNKKVKFPHIFEWYKQCYEKQSEKSDTLFNLIRTNKAYNGLTHPTIKNNDNKYLPNFKYRYLTEDIPYGLAVIRGYALILENDDKYKDSVKNSKCTVLLDKILLWVQKVMNKQYFIFDKNNQYVTGVGKDINQTRAPQRYGFTTVQDLM